MITATANVITNDDIDSISVSGPEKWEAYNIDLLFDGIDYRYSNTRFAAYQNGGERLSQGNPFVLSVALINNSNISSLSFFNDWRHQLSQQVTSMDVVFYSRDNNLLWSDSFSGLKKNSWDEVDIISFDTPIFDVANIDFKITGAQSDHFEIRELLVGADTKLQQSYVSAPNVVVFFLIAISALVFRHYLQKRTYNT
ncbi:MAG: hypothetical protein ACJAVV_002282 [Alphaproteobacteria bacterium]|jgi:hypothetical protein